MQPQAQQIDQVMRKLRTLSPEGIAEVENFIHLLRQRDGNRQVTHAAMAAPEPVLNAIWDNPDHAE